MAKIRNWRGNQIVTAVKGNVAKGLGKFGLRVQGHAMHELEHGHGVKSGTLRRSLHVAEPGYNWSADDVKPGPQSPNRNGMKFNAVINGRKVTIQVGSGLRYALAVHQGHHSFAGYHYLTIGLEKAKPDLARDLAEYRLK